MFSRVIVSFHSVSFQDSVCTVYQSSLQFTTLYNQVVPDATVNHEGKVSYRVTTTQCDVSVCSFQHRLVGVSFAVSCRVLFEMAGVDWSISLLLPTQFSDPAYRETLFYVLLHSWSRLRSHLGTASFQMHALCLVQLMSFRLPSFYAPQDTLSCLSGPETVH